MLNIVHFFPTLFYFSVCPRSNWGLIYTAAMSPWAIYFSCNPNFLVSRSTDQYENCSKSFFSPKDTSYLNGEKSFAHSTALQRMDSPVAVGCTYKELKTSKMAPRGCWVSSTLAEIQYISTLIDIYEIG